MGVRDLGQVLLKHAPNSFKHVNSLNDFRGKTLALDANLLTIKFHHRKRHPPYASKTKARSSSGVLDATAAAAVGSVPAEDDPNKHVKCWYDLLSQLKRRGIKAIVVFDGSTRIPEKARENERRREGRELQRKRGEAESSRADRLREVKALWAEVAVEDRAQVAREFVALVGQKDATKAPPPTDETLNPAQRLLQLYEAFQLDAPNPIYSKNQTLLTSSESLFFSHLLHLGILPTQAATPRIAGEADALTESISSVLDSDAAPPSSPPPIPAFGEESLPPILDPTREDAQQMDLGLAELLKQSEKLGASHLSRSAKVPAYALADSLTLIQALGIPCLLPPADSPVEAESLCSSLCLMGLADYVVSEDSDVTVYGAPLLRQIGVASGTTRNKDGTEKKKGMNVLDPKAVRKALGLSHAAFVDFCILCGTDFTDRIPLIGPMTALALVQRFGSIEVILTQHPAALPALESAGTSASEYMQTVHAARALFLKPAPLPEGLADKWWKEKRPIRKELREVLVRFGIREDPAAKAKEESAAEDEDVLSVARESDENDEIPPEPETGMTDDEMRRLAEKMQDM